MNLKAQSIRQHAEQAGVDLGAALPNNTPENAEDVPLSDRAICARYDDCSVMTIKRWRARLGFPYPSFRVGQTAFTWRSQILRWEQAQGAAFRNDGKPVRKASGSGADEAA